MIDWGLFEDAVYCFDIALGMEAKNIEKVDRDIAKYTEAIELDPNEASTFIKRGVAYEAKHDYDNAITDFTTAINMGDNSGYINRGSVYQQKGEYDKAISDLSTLIGMDPRASVAYWERGQVYICMREYDKAILDYSKPVEMYPRDDSAYRLRGLAYYEMGESDRAMADLDKAIKLKPDCENIHQRAWIYACIGEYDRAIDAFSAVCNGPAKQVLWFSDYSMCR